MWLDGGWHRPSRRDPFSCEWQPPRPLYGLAGLCQRPNASVLVVENRETNLENSPFCALTPRQTAFIVAETAKTE